MNGLNFRLFVRRERRTVTHYDFADCQDADDGCPISFDTVQKGTLYLGLRFAMFKTVVGDGGQQGVVYFPLSQVERLVVTETEEEFLSQKDMADVQAEMDGVE